MMPPLPLAREIAEMRKVIISRRKVKRPFGVFYFIKF